MTSAAGRLWTDGCLYSVIPHPCQEPLLWFSLCLFSLNLEKG